MSFRTGDTIVVSTPHYSSCLRFYFTRGDQGTFVNYCDREGNPDPDGDFIYLASMEGDDPVNVIVSCECYMPLEQWTKLALAT